MGGVAGDICLCSKYVTVGIDILARDEPQRFILHALEGIEVGFAGAWLPSCRCIVEYAAYLGKDHLFQLWFPPSPLGVCKCCQDSGFVGARVSNR